MEALLALAAPLLRILGIGVVALGAIAMARWWIQRGTGAVVREKLKDEMEEDRRAFDEKYERELADMRAFLDRLRARKRRADLPTKGK